jgi:hypothetical protein
LYVYGFRFYFTPLAGVLFAFPSRYWFTIGQSGVFSLGGWSPHIQTGCHVSRPTRSTHSICIFKYGAITLYGRTFQTVPLTHTLIRFWAAPRSLAATRGISVDFFSSGYLDVSVPLVRFVKLCIHLTIVQRVALGFPIRKSSVITLHISLPTLIAD